MTHGIWISSRIRISRSIWILRGIWVFARDLDLAWDLDFARRAFPHRAPVLGIPFIFLLHYWGVPPQTPPATPLAAPPAHYWGVPPQTPPTRSLIPCIFLPQYWGIPHFQHPLRITAPPPPDHPRSFLASPCHSTAALLRFRRHMRITGACPPRPPPPLAIAIARGFAHLAPPPSRLPIAPRRCVLWPQPRDRPVSDCPGSVAQSAHTDLNGKHWLAAAVPLAVHYG